MQGKIMSNIYCMQKHLSEKISRLRKEKGLTLEKLSKITETSKVYTWQLEKNSTNP